MAADEKKKIVRLIPDFFDINISCINRSSHTRVNRFNSWLVITQFLSHIGFHRLYCCLQNYALVRSSIYTTKHYWYESNKKVLMHLALHMKATTSRSTLTRANASARHANREATCFIAPSFFRSHSRTNQSRSKAPPPHPYVGLKSDLEVKAICYKRGRIVKGKSNSYAKATLNQTLPMQRMFWAVVK